MRTCPLIAIGLAALATSLIGCAAEKMTGATQDSKTAEVVDSGGHAHATAGPHQGHLVELGNEDYHAEVVHDEEAGTVAIYVLDGAATKQVPIDAGEVMINAKHDGQPKQYKLTALPDANDPPGMSSRFVSNEADLAIRLDADGADPRLVLMIQGKSYRGLFSHDHD